MLSTLMLRQLQMPSWAKSSTAAPIKPVASSATLTVLSTVL
ncbi:hypothetical protein THAR02_03754 [Trichoderma harzianum]|uniref:Uncharacterized protein n=1 Tax=Trichoderma harzianum TaxID=5544 RepID=A0A0F9ZVP9_TRIHA|nr:hypothetical protein THAR02_03754 [Trichoderma harzianum]